MILHFLHILICQIKCKVEDFSEVFIIQDNKYLHVNSSSYNLEFKDDISFGTEFKFKKRNNKKFLIFLEETNFVLSAPINLRHPVILKPEGNKSKQEIRALHVRDGDYKLIIMDNYCLNRDGKKLNIQRCGTSNPTETFQILKPEVAKAVVENRNFGIDPSNDVVLKIKGRGALAQKNSDKSFYFSPSKNNKVLFKVKKVKNGYKFLLNGDQALTYDKLGVLKLESISKINPAQIFTFKPEAGDIGVYKIINTTSGLCLTENNYQVLFNYCTDDPSQNFKIDSSDENDYERLFYLSSVQLYDVIGLNSNKFLTHTNNISKAINFQAQKRYATPDKDVVALSIPATGQYVSLMGEYLVSGQYPLRFKIESVENNIILKSNGKCVTKNFKPPYYTLSKCDNSESQLFEKVYDKNAIRTGNYDKEVFDQNELYKMDKVFYKKIKIPTIASVNGFVGIDSIPYENYLTSVSQNESQSLSKGLDRINKEKKQ